MKQLRLRKFMAAPSLLATASLLAVSGYGQTPSPTPTPTPPSDVQTLGKFEVTGSLIKVSEVVGPAPVDVITDRVIRSSGVTDATQLLKKMNPDFMGNGNASTEVNNGGGGEANIALRNLTTLVLLNGRRMVGSPFSNGASVDLNSIPLGMIDRIEVFKDGGATLYGSDAISGVVNIILKKNYEGFEVSARYGATRNRDYTTRGFSLIGGVAKEGTSITIGADYFRNDQLSSTARAVASLSAKQLAANGASAALPSYYSGSFSGRVGNFILAGSPLAVGAPGYVASRTSPPLRTDPNQAPQTIDQLVAAGIYIPIASTPASVAASGSTSILNTTQYGTASIVPTDRRQVVLSAEHEIYSKQLVLFADGMFAATTNSGSVLAPSPLAGVGANNLIIPANNPYNPFGIGLGTGFTGDPGVRLRLEEIGNRSGTDKTDTYRLVSGLKGDINENYSWQVDGTYAHAEGTQNVFGGANGSVMNRLLIPQIVNGAYVLNSAGMPLSTYTDAAGNALPVFNFFAVPGFKNDPRTLNAIRTVLFKAGTTSLEQLNALIRGTPYALPAGRIGFALGGEYRREKLSASVDGLYAQGLALGYNAASTFAGGVRSTKSVMGEVEIPVFGGGFSYPGAYTMSVNVSGRYEKLSSGASSKVPRLGIKWQPLDRDLTIRGTYSKGFIAPSIFDLFGPAQGNSPTFTIQEGTGSSSGGSTGRSVTGQFGGNTQELSNPALQPSESIARTAGVVYSPKYVPGLSVSADYYFVKQNRVGAIDYTGVYRDLNAKGSGSQYAPTFFFADGSKLTSTAPNQITSSNIGGISVQKSPSGEQYTDGLDLGVDYKVPASLMANYGRLDIGTNANVLFNYKFRSTLSGKNNQYARQQTSSTYGLGGSNGVLPGYKITSFANYAWHGISSTLLVSYMPSVVDAGSLFAGQSTTNAKTASGLAYTVPSYTTVDLSVGYTLPFDGWMKGISVLAGVNNLTNKTAPYIPDGNEDNTDKRSYDIIGRFYFFEFSKKF